MHILKAIIPMGAFMLAGCETLDAKMQKLPNEPIDGVESVVKSDGECCEHSFPLAEADLDGHKLKTKLLLANDFPHADGDLRVHLTLSPTQAHNVALQAHIDYLAALYPCVKRAGGVIVLSEGDFGPGHTTRRVTPYRWFNITPGDPAPNYGNDIFNTYFSGPVNLDTTTQPHVSTEGLKYNQKYAIEYSIWIDQNDDDGDGVGDCEKFISAEDIQDCWGVEQQVNFDFVANEAPSIAGNQSGVSNVLLRIYDYEGVIVKEIPQQIRTK